MSAHYVTAHERVASGQWIVEPVAGRVISKRTGKPMGAPLRFANGYEAGLRLLLPGGYVLAHRLIWEHVNGPLKPNETVRHRNGNRYDNRIDNLYLQGTGTWLHAAAQRTANPLIAIADEDEITEIRRRRAEGASLRALAEEFILPVAEVAELLRGAA